MKLKVTWIIGGIVAFLIFAIAYMPAIHVIGRIALPKNIAVSGVSGTLLEGKAQSVVVNGLPINNVKWDINPWAFFIGKLRADLKAGNIRNVNDIAFEGPVSTGLFTQRHVVVNLSLIHI